MENPLVRSNSLDTYRKNATFNPEKLKVFIETEEVLQLKNKIWKTLESDPLFQRPVLTPPLDEIRRIAAVQSLRFKDYEFMSLSEVFSHPLKVRIQTFTSSEVALVQDDNSPISLELNKMAGIICKLTTTADGLQQIKQSQRQ